MEHERQEPAQQHQQQGPESVAVTVELAEAPAAAGMEGQQQQQPQQRQQEPPCPLQLARHEFVSRTGIDNLRLYAYSGVDNSISARLFLNAFWNWSVEFLPRWVAPNVVTLCGGAFVLAAYSLCAAFSPTLQGAVPGPVLVFAGVMIHLYQLADNLDGKQARRTKNGSPLGELFDHGVDSLTMVLIGAIVACMLAPTPYVGLIIIIASLGPFFLSHWEEYHAGILVMGQFTGPTEMHHAVVFLLYFTAFVGAGWWQRPFLLYSSITYSAAMQIGLCIGCVAATVSNALSVWRLASSGQSKLGSTPLQAMTHPSAYVIFAVLAAAWVSLTPDVVAEHPHAHIVAVMLLFGYVSQRLIVQRICKEPIRLAYRIHAAQALAAVNALFYALDLPCLSPVVVLWLLMLCAAAMEAVFVTSIINQMCATLGIRPFTVKKIVPAEAQSV